MLGGGIRGVGCGLFGMPGGRGLLWSGGGVFGEPWRIGEGGGFGAVGRRKGVVALWWRGRDCGWLLVFDGRLR